MYTILICDDDRDIVSALDIYLTSEGYRTVKAYDGLEALRAAEREAVDLILLDIMMPNLDGIRTTAKLREKLEIDPANPRYIKVVWGLGYKMEKL